MRDDGFGATFYMLQKQIIEYEAKNGEKPNAVFMGDAVFMDIMKNNKHESYMSINHPVNKHRSLMENAEFLGIPIYRISPVDKFGVGTIN